MNGERTVLVPIKAAHDAPGLLKVAFVVGAIVGMLFLASGVVDMVPDVVWAWAVTIVAVGGLFGVPIVATVWDIVKSLRRRS